MATYRKPAPNVTSLRRRHRHATKFTLFKDTSSKLALLTNTSSKMTNYRKPEPRIEAMPAEILDLIARHTFRGQVIKLRNPLELGTAKLFALLNPIASILCIEGAVGQRATEVMLEEVIFTLPNLHILGTHNLRHLDQLHRIRNLGLTVLDMGTSNAEHYLSHLPHLTRLTVTMDWCDAKRAPPSEITRGWMLSVCRGLRLGRGDVMAVRRLLWEGERAYEVELRIAVHRGQVDLFKDLNVISDEEQAAFKGCECPRTCVVVLSGAGIVDMDVMEEEDVEGWRGAVGRDFRMEGGGILGVELVGG